LSSVLNEKAESVTYRSTKEEVEQLLTCLGQLLYLLLETDGAEQNHDYALMKRVFEEQYEAVYGPGGGKKKRIKLREKHEISSRSLQNPHDPDSEYRNKNGDKVKGYSINVTETCDEKPGLKPALNLIVDVRTKGCSISDVEYLQDGLAGAQEIVIDKIEEVYTDGAYHSPGNQKYCNEKGIDWVLPGIQGKPSKYDLSFDAAGNLLVVNTLTGRQLEAKRSKSRNSQTEGSAAFEAPDRWVIKDGDNSPIYFEQKDVETCGLRKRLGEIPKEQLNIRNNVEATIFQLGYHYRSDKSQYRGLMKHHIWANIRCLWINFRRIHLWITRKTENSDNGGRAVPEGSLVFYFLRRFLPGYQCFSWRFAFDG